MSIQFLHQTRTDALSAECTRIGQMLHAACEATEPPMPRTHGPVAEIADRFGLTLFERDILTFAIAVEINAEVAALASRVAAAPRAGFATFGVAIQAFENPDWQALSPHRPLRHLRLIELTLPERLLVSEIRVDERILHALFSDDSSADDTAPDSIDHRLCPYLIQLQQKVPPGAGLAEVAEKISLHFNQNKHQQLVLKGRHRSDVRRTVQAAAGSRGVWLLDPALLPASAVERESFARLWEREARLSGAYLLIETEGNADAGCINRLLQGQPGPIVLAGHDPYKPDIGVLSLEVPQPSRPEQTQLWRRALGPHARRLSTDIDSLTQNFDLGESDISALADKVLLRGQVNGNALWEACRSSARPRLGSLAQRVPALAGWNDLILPDEARATLHVLIAQVRRRHRVYQDWGFAGKSNRGLGTTALFAGPSGTGKTMAAEVIARELNLDLYRIDLSAVVSKYIGETEKNLRVLFDAAEGTGAILLFDEADALFGKRSEVSDARDRYANIEVSYLLQRMESYAGIAILTTNMRSAIDDAFLRRIRFAVNFPFPNCAARLQIWKSVFPEEALLGPLAWEKLARLEMSAGHIRNIALNAAFLAAENSMPIAMEHLLQSAMIECANIEKPLTPTEVAGWTT